jgi:hypothetical protein
VVAAFMLVTGTLDFGDAHWRITGAGSLTELRAVAAAASKRATPFHFPQHGAPFH